MFEFCDNPKDLVQYGGQWFSCFLTTKKHMNLYYSLFTVLGIMASVAPLALLLGFMGMLAKRSSIGPIKIIGLGYTNMVRGIPDIVFFLFVPLAIDMGLELARHGLLCPGWDQPIFQGLNFNICRDAKIPAPTDPRWFEDSYNFVLAVVAYSLVFGAFAATVLDGARNAVPRAQIETATAFGLSRVQTFVRVALPQMWVYAMPGLSNLWLLLIKATPLLFLLGIEDLVFWALELGGRVNNRRALYPHGDWLVYYFFGLLVFYLCFTWISQKVLDRLYRHVSRGMNTIGTSSGGARV